MVLDAKNAEVDAERTLKEPEDAVSDVAEVVASVVVPEAVRTLVVRELEKTPSVARRSAVKKLPVDVALVKDAERAERRLDTVREFVVRTLVVILVAEALERVVVPVTVRVDAVVVAKVVVPKTESIPEKDGLGVRPMVEVPEKRMLAPALKNEIGEL
jgi:hypothetical protein